MSSFGEFTGAIPERLLWDLKRGRCALFVGAGLSSQVRRSNGSPLPGWNALLLEICAQAQRGGQVVSQDIFDAIDKGALLEVGQEIQDRFPEALDRTLTALFGDPDLQPSGGHMLIPKIRFRAVLTTNYDGLIEEAFRQAHRRSPPTFTHRQVHEVHEPLRSGKLFIFKVHGDYRDPSGLILGTRAYQDLMHRDSGYRFLLESVLDSNTVLFVGFGGSDPDIIHALDALSSRFRNRTQRHYILLPRGRWTLIERRRHDADRCLETIEYDDSGNHGQVVSFLHQLAYPRPLPDKFLVAYNSYSPDGGAMLQAIEAVRAEPLDLGSADRPQWFDEARALVELSRFVIAPAWNRGRLGDDFLELLVTRLGVPLIPLEDCPTPGASPDEWRSQIQSAIERARFLVQS